jgi:hypothetical protein
MMPRVEGNDMKKHLGAVFVDSGLIWIGDPCYTLPADASHNPGDDWDQFVAELGKSDTPREPTMKNFKGIGVCSSTGYGDGSYPVTADVVDGRVRSITVVFISDDDEA